MTHRQLSSIRRFAILACAIGPALPLRADALNKGQQWFVDNGLQIMALIGDPSRGVPFHLSTYQGMGYTSQLWEWHTDSAQLTTSWGRWVSDPSDMPPVGAESSHMGTLKHLGLGDEANINDATIRDQMVAWYNSAHANPTFNSVLLWNNQWGGQITDAALGDFITRAQPDMISHDTYPYQPSAQPGGGSPTNWYGAFRQYRQWGMDTSTTVGFYRQTYASPSGAPQTRAVSASELSLQTFAGLAFNAKSIQDFTYNFSGTTLFVGGSGDDTLAPLGTAAQVMNAEAKSLGPALVRLKPVADPTLPNWTSSMMFIRGKNTNASNYNAIPIGYVVDPQGSAYTEWVQGRNDPYMLEPSTATNLGSKNLGLPGDMIVSWFRVMDETMDGAWTNEKYFMVTNGLADMNATEAETRQSVTLNFDFGGSGITQLQRLSRVTGLVEDVGLTPQGGSLYSLSLTLDGGRGDLFKFKNGAPFVGLQSPTQLTLYWDNDATAAGNNTTSGAGLGGTGVWDGAALKWFNGTSDIAYAAGDVVFYGTAGTVTLASPQSANSLTFKTTGYTITGSTLTIISPSITVDPGATATISSVIAGSAGLVKNGAGTLNLAIANTYTGGTTINEGVLGIISSSLGQNPSSPVTNITINNGATLRFNQNNLALTVNRQVYLGTGGGIIDTAFTNTINGNISGSSLTKTGTGTLILTSTGNTYADGTTVAGGVLRVSSDSNLGTAPTSLTSNITLEGGALQFGADFDIGNTRGITLGASGGTIDTNGFSNPTGYNPVDGFRGGNLTKTGSGTFFASATSAGLNTLWTGNLIIKQGTWKIVATDGLPFNPPVASGLQPAQVTLDGGTWQIGATINATNARRGITVSSGGGTIDTQGFDLTWAGPLAGTVSSATLTKIGSGTLRLLSSAVAAGTYAGNTHVAAGTLRLDGGTAMGDLSAVSLANVSGATLNVTGNETIGSLAGGGTNGGNVVLGAVTLTTGGNNASTTFAGVISGAGGNVTKVGSGTMVLTGANIYTGSTTVSGGKLVLGQSLTSSSSLLVQDASTIELSPSGNKILKTGSVAFTGSGKLDLKDNKAVVSAQTVGSWNGSVYTGVQRLVQSGLNDGTWDGGGIVTSMPPAMTGLTTLAVATAAQAGYAGGSFGGVSVASTDVLVMYTYIGDANLDGMIDGTDYFHIDNGVSTPGTDGFGNGDFNYDGNINSTDYFYIDNNIVDQGAPFSTSAGFLSLAVDVPESMSVVWFISGALLLGSTRRQRTTMEAVAIDHTR